MAKRIENRSDGQREFTVGIPTGKKDAAGNDVVKATTIVVPRSTKDDSGIVTNGSAAVDDAVFAEAMKDPGFAAMFGEKSDLLVAGDAPSKPAESKPSDKDKK